MSSASEPLVLSVWQLGRPSRGYLGSTLSEVSAGVFVGTSWPAMSYEVFINLSYPL